MSQKCPSVLAAAKGRVAAQMCALAFEFKNGHVIPEHHHPEDQLVFASKGTMTIYAKGGMWVIPPLRAVWIPAGTPHQVAITGAASMRTLYLRPRLIAAMPRGCVVVNVSPLLRELILHACNLSRLRLRVPAQQRIVALMADLLKDARTAPLQLPLPSDARARRVADALLVEPAGNETLENLCKHSGASKRTIQRAFLAETNMSFGKWRQQLRLLHALPLLNSGHKIASIALDAGYESPSAFIAMFKKQLGTTPRRYFSD